jgi:hypothetical protein
VIQLPEKYKENFDVGCWRKAFARKRRRSPCIFQFWPCDIVQFIHKKYIQNSTNLSSKHLPEQSRFPAQKTKKTLLKILFNVNSHYPIRTRTHVKISQLVNKMCSQQACSKLVNKVVTMLLFYQVATRLSLTTCWQIVELQDDNKLLEQLVTSL